MATHRYRGIRRDGEPATTPAVSDTSPPAQRPLPDRSRLSRRDRPRAHRATIRARLPLLTDGGASAVALGCRHARRRNRGPPQAVADGALSTRSGGILAAVKPTPRAPPPPRSKQLSGDARREADRAGWPLPTAWAARCSPTRRRA